MDTLDGFIDREIEREVFSRMLLFEDNTRLLTIKEKSGQGKTSLLQRFRYEYQFIIDIPVSFNSLDQIQITGSFSLVKAIHEDLSNLGELKFKRFDTLNHARIFQNPATFTDFISSGSMVTDVETTENKEHTFAPAQIDNIGQGVETITLKQLDEWTTDQEELARQLCVVAFFEDLKTICKEKPVVILLDAWEKCAEPLQHWIVRQMLHNYCFNESDRPAKLIFVLAGRTMPEFEAMLGDRYQNLVIRLEELSKWSKGHIKEFLQGHGYEGLNDETISVISQYLDHGKSLVWCLSAVKALLAE